MAGAPRAPASGGGVRVGWAPRCSLFKRPAEAPRARPAPAAQTCRVGWRRLACGRGRGRGAERLRSPRPSCSGRSRPSRSLPSAPAWLSLPLAPSTARSLARSHFSCCRCRGARTSVGCASGRLPLHSLPSPEPSVGPRFPEPPRPFPPARTPRSAAAGAGLPGAPQLARSLSPEQPLQPGRQLLPASSGTPGGSAPGSVRSVSAARRGPGSGRRENQPPAAASPRPRGGRARPRPLRAVQTSPVRGELWPAGTRRRGRYPPASGAGCGGDLG